MMLGLTDKACFFLQNSTHDPECLSTQQNSKVVKQTCESEALLYMLESEHNAANDRQDYLIPIFDSQERNQ